ncbi:MAG: methyltransferase domain-containing protein [Proteobacteria bacterium]|nr:methyltransferase domain-containing protein [Pseudomonadota bacterium]
MQSAGIRNFDPDELASLFDLKYRGSAGLGPDPARRRRFNYYNPDDHYEALIRKLVQPQTRWLEVGCGRHVFPSNPALAKELAARCALLTGVDPDETIEENPFVHDKVRGMVEDLDPELRFDLVTLRMVAEHVADPADMLETLSNLVVPNGIVVIYTINKWSPVPIATAVTPFSLHHPIKYVLWRGEEKDTFPTTYKMNTRTQLRELFSTAGFAEDCFWYLDDCRTFQRFRLLNLLELSAWRVLKAMGLRYPENCLLGVYRRRS